MNDKEIQLMKEDYDNDWWKASAVDEYDLKKKLIRVGCRPLKRKYDKCVVEYDELSYSKCKMLNSQLKECYNALYSIYYVGKKDELLQTNQTK